MKKLLFNIFCFAWALLFAYLGYWQVERLHWKEGLIAQMEKYKGRHPVEFHIDKFDPKEDLFEKVFLNGKFLHQDEMLLAAKYFSSKRDKNQLGYHVITPFLTTEGVVVLINRGWVPEQYKAAQSRPESLYQGNIETTVEGMIRENHGKAPWFMPQNMPEKDIWFWIDLPEMIKKLESKGVGNVRPVLIQQTNLTTNNGFKYPVPLSANIEFYNQHLTYVITWFSLAFVTLLMCYIYNRKQKGK